MQRYYFYAPSKYRIENKKFGILAFELQAFYTEKAYSQKLRKEITNFNQIDDLAVRVNTQTPGQYAFSFEHGKDGGMGHYAKSYQELKQELHKWDYRPVDEKNYFRLRKLALKLMYRHSNFYYYF